MISSRTPAVSGDMVLSPALLAALAPFGRNGVQTNASLAPYTSFRIGGPAAALLVIRQLTDLTGALAVLSDYGAPFLVLGGGSNVLCSDAGVRAVVLLNQCRRIVWPAEGIGGDQGVGTVVQAESGVLLAGLARGAIQRRLAGLAWAVSVPGTVGGAVVGNAGAHGGCVADNLNRARIWQDGQLSEWTASRLEFGYRTSILKTSLNDGIGDRAGQGPVVLSASFALGPDPDGIEQEHARTFIEHRRRTQPVDKSAGSMFKNPPGDFAGRLIEAAGIKGTSAGGAAISTVHGNFIINQGGATAADVIQLMNQIRRRVHDRFGVVLEPEIRFIGDWGGRPILESISSDDETIGQWTTFN